MNSIILEDLYKKLNKKQKLELFDNWGIDCLTDFENKVKQELSSRAENNLTKAKNYIDWLLRIVEAHYPLYYSDDFIAEISDFIYPD